MSEIKNAEQQSLSEAIINYITGVGCTIGEVDKQPHAFQSGADWQKEQLKVHMQKVIDTLENDFAKQLVANVTNILFS